MLTDDRRPGVDPLMLLWAVVFSVLVVAVVLCVVIVAGRT